MTTADVDRILRAAGAVVAPGLAVASGSVRPFQCYPDHQVRVPNGRLQPVKRRAMGTEPASAQACSTDREADAPVNSCLDHPRGARITIIGPMHLVPLFVSVKLLVNGRMLLWLKKKELLVNGLRQFVLPASNLDHFRLAANHVEE